MVGFAVSLDGEPSRRLAAARCHLGSLTPPLGGRDRESRSDRILYLPGKKAGILALTFSLSWLVGTGLSGCGNKPPKPTRLEASVVTAPDVNQDAAGRALPIVVRVYELKTTGSFQSADFFSLYDREAATLGGDLLAREELNLRPGEQHRIERETAPDAQHLGVLGAFRDIDRASWRATRALRPGETNKVEINLSADAVSMR